MVSTETKKQLSTFLNELYTGVGQPGFLFYTCEEYKRIMKFQRCHIVHLQNDGQFNFEYKNENDDYYGIEKYQSEDIWRPDNTGEPIKHILHLRIDKKFHRELSDKFNLYDWLYNDLKAVDSLGTIHPCNTAFTCFRLGEEQLDEEEYKLHVETTNKIINLYYLDRRLKQGAFFEQLFQNYKTSFNQSSSIILDSKYNVFYEDIDIQNKLIDFDLNYRDLVIKIKNKIKYSKPKLRNFDIEYRLQLINKDKKINITINTLNHNKSLFYICNLEITDINTVHFSSREVDILRLVGDGLSNNEIAESLFITKDTVKKHLYNMMQKTKSRNRVELLKYHDK